MKKCELKTWKNARKNTKMIVGAKKILELKEDQCLFAHLMTLIYDLFSFARFLAGIPQALANYFGPVRARPEHQELHALATPYECVWVL